MVWDRGTHHLQVTHRIRTHSLRPRPVAIEVYLLTGDRHENAMHTIQKVGQGDRKHSAEGRKEVEDDEVEVILLLWLIDSYGF